MEANTKGMGSGILCAETENEKDINGNRSRKGKTKEMKEQKRGKAEHDKKG